MRRLTALVVALCVLASTGCTPAPAELPSLVTVSVFQNRFDYGIRQLELKVSNGSDEPITIIRATLESSRFTEPAVWDRPQLVPSGSARDLKVLLGPPSCAEGTPTDTVVLDFTLADGTTGSASIEPTDEMGRLEVIASEDCLGAAIAEHATITPPDYAVWTPGAHEPAIIDIAVSPTSAPGSATIVFAKGTVLLSLVDDTGTEVYEQQLGIVVTADSPPSVIRLLVVPSRCDPHAVAEDKRGTFFPLEVEADGQSGRIFVAVSDTVRASLYEFFADYCGLP